MVPYKALRTVGHEVDAVCPEKEAGETVETAVHDFRGDQTYVESRGHDFELNATLSEVDPEEHDALVVPGGRAPKYRRGYDEVLDAERHSFEADKPVAALCHGLQILAAADVLDGRTCTASPALRSEVETAGAEWAEGVARDGNLVTGQAWPDHPGWLSAILDVLCTEIDHGEPVAADD